MTVAVALQLRDRGLAAPYRTVLISPWLDVTLTAPDIPSACHEGSLPCPRWPRRGGRDVSRRTPGRGPTRQPDQRGPFRPRTDHLVQRNSRHPSLRRQPFRAASQRGARVD
jgi:hypothetical protein